MWILFLSETSGEVVAHKHISRTSGGFNFNLRFWEFFGSSVSALGDWDGDGVGDIAIGHSGDDTGPGADVGSVWITRLKRDGSVKAATKIHSGTSGFSGNGLGDANGFGYSSSFIRASRGGGEEEALLAVSAFRYRVGSSTSAVFVLSLNSDCTVKQYTRITSNSGGIVGSVDSGGEFGSSVTWVGDLD